MSSRPSVAPTIAFGRSFGQTPAVRHQFEFAWETETRRPNNSAPYRTQGNEEFDAEESLIERRKLRFDSAIQVELNSIWHLMKKTRSGQLSRDSYISFFIRICHLLNPDLSYKESLKIVENDWIQDLKYKSDEETKKTNENNSAELETEHENETGNQSKAADSSTLVSNPVNSSDSVSPDSASSSDVEMSREQFFHSLFELADQWTNSVEAGEYVEFLRKLIGRITVNVKPK